ncbi:hypothetical protein D3C81_10140 [compost metagenome]
MDIKLKYAGDMQGVDFNIPTIMKGKKEYTAIPELCVSTGNSKTRLYCLGTYLKAISYLFQGVSNYASSQLPYVSISKDWFGSVTKDREVIKWDSLIDRTSVIVYNMSYLQIEERMYVADGVEQREKVVQPLWLDSLLRPDSDYYKHSVVSAISIATEYVDGYTLSWSDKLGTLIITKDGAVVNIDDIKNDNSYILIKFLYLLIAKGKHEGVILLDCARLTDKTITGIVETARIFFGDSFVFLYNCSKNSNVDRIKVELPNFER